MAVNDLSTENNALTINGRLITDWGESATCYTAEDIDPRTVLRRGQGGNAVRLDRQNFGKRVSLALNPGGPDSAFMSGLNASKANITLGRQQIGTLETETGLEGVIVSVGPTGRAGQTVTDDIYNIEFNSWDELKGGN